MAGHCQDSNVKKALKGLERHCTYLKMLGSYPAALQKKML
jgi:prephenate dehydratase